MIEIIYKKGKENVVVDDLSQQYEGRVSLFTLLHRKNLVE
jgi:hypothetical protein